MLHGSETSFNQNFLAWRFQYNVHTIKTQLGPAIDGALTSCGALLPQVKMAVFSIIHRLLPIPSLGLNKYKENRLTGFDILTIVTYS